MSNQLFIEVEVIKPDLYNEALKQYEKNVKLKYLHPVHIIFNKKTEKYLVSSIVTPQSWLNMDNYLIVK